MKRNYITIFVALVIFSALSLAEIEISYDDGIPYIPNFFFKDKNSWAVRFTPTQSPGNILQGKIYIKSGTTELHTCNISIWNDKDRYPNIKVWGPKKFVNIKNDDWNYYDINFPWSGGDFYITYTQIGWYPDCDGVYCDPKPQYWRSYQCVDDEWSLFGDDEHGDLLIRCIYREGNVINNTSFGIIKALYR
ncbi:MAG: hypothetical protein ACUVWP_09105 [bacterium]